MPRDANDILRKDGEEGLRLAVDNASSGDMDMPPDPDRPMILGSDDEVACRIIEDLKRRYGHVVYSDGELYVWSGTSWCALTSTELYRFFERYDGWPYGVKPNGTAKAWALNNRRRKDITELVNLKVTQPDFFDDEAVGINTVHGFIRFDPETGEARCVPCDPEHRKRHDLDVKWTREPWSGIPADSLLGALFSGCFQDDPEAQLKIDLLAEGLASAMLGITTQLAEPKALVLFGPTAANGKSTILKLFNTFLPEKTRSALTPAQLSDKFYRVGLAGKWLNASDELGSAAIESDTFKLAITGDQTTARQLHTQAVSFRPRAQHIYATNTLPPFKDGMDRGVLRRLLVIGFDRTIPIEERIPDLHKAIIQEEADLVLRWIIDGASRLIVQNGFTQLPSSDAHLRDWANISDLFAGFLADEDWVHVTENRDHVEKTQTVYQSFRLWCRKMGYRDFDLPTQPLITRQVNAGKYPGIKAGRNSSMRCLRGLQLVSERKAMTE